MEFNFCCYRVCCIAHILLVLCLDKILYQYSKSNSKNQAEYNIIFPSKDNSPGLSDSQYDSVIEVFDEMQSRNKKPRVTYKEEDKQKIAKYAGSHGVANAIRFFQKNSLTCLEVLCVLGLINKKLKQNQ